MPVWSRNIPSTRIQEWRAHLGERRALLGHAAHAADHRRCSIHRMWKTIAGNPSGRCTWPIRSVHGLQQRKHLPVACVVFFWNALGFPCNPLSVHKAKLDTQVNGCGLHYDLQVEQLVVSVKRPLVASVKRDHVEDLTSLELWAALSFDEALAQVRGVHWETQRHDTLLSLRRRQDHGLDIRSSTSPTNTS
eukprot:2117067-Amphidinium_carterae.1